MKNEITVEQGSGNPASLTVGDECLVWGRKSKEDTAIKAYFSYYESGMYYFNKNKTTAINNKSSFSRTLYGTKAQTWKNFRRTI